MTSNLAEWRSHQREQARIQDLFHLIPNKGETALDIGARDGYLSRLLAERFEHVVALDLEKPTIAHPRIEAIKGDASRLTFADNSFDVVLCAEVLEHIHPSVLGKVCDEIVRVTSGVAVVGVPYRQDLRVGRSICLACHRHNPPWGHVNSFDHERLLRLFEGLSFSKVSYVGETTSSTNALSSYFMDLAGNPYGTYEQDEPCVHCGAALTRPSTRTLAQKLASKAAHWLDAPRRLTTRPRANWIHVRFDKLTA